MRIISGKLKGRKIPELKNVELRPTTDFAKEGLFNILQNQINFFSINALDLFSGTGSLSYELASRGVSSVTAVENSAFAVKFINEMKSVFLLESNIEAIQSDVFFFLDKHTKKYSLIIADPPFSLETKDYQKLYEKSILLLEEKGMLVIEHSASIDLSTMEKFTSQRKYGSVNFSFFNA